MFVEFVKPMCCSPVGVACAFVVGENTNNGGSQVWNVEPILAYSCHAELVSASTFKHWDCGVVQQTLKRVQGDKMESPLVPRIPNCDSFRLLLLVISDLLQPSHFVERVASEQRGMFQLKSCDSFNHEVVIVSTTKWWYFCSCKHIF